MAFTANTLYKASDLDLSIRFKHGIHTIFLFVDPMAPFSAVTTELLQVLRERYPQGLTKSISPPQSTPVPTSGDDAHISYALLVNPYDPTQGWKNLNIKGTETPLEKDLKDNMVIAFAIRGSEGPGDDEPEFIVDWPQLDEEDGGVADEEEIDEDVDDMEL